MKLNSENRIGFMVDSHGDSAVVSKGVDFQAGWDAINDKRMIRYFTKRRMDFDCSKLTTHLPMIIEEEIIEPVNEPAS